MSGPRPLRLMADYGCSPLWQPGHAEYVVNPEDLLVDDALCADLWAWAARFDATLNADDPACSGFASGAAQSAFIADGAALATRLQDALGAGFVVEYSPPR